MSRSAIPALAVALTAIAGPHASAPVQDQRSVFSSRVEAVRVDALVTENGRTVPNLTAADFVVTDNGVSQQVDLLSFDQIPLNVVMALDISSSLTGERLAQLRSAGALLVDRLKAGDQGALVTFSDTVTLRAGLTTDLGRVHDSITATRPGAGSRPTALIDAVFAALLSAESDVGRALVVIFSDGVDTGSWLRGPAVIDAAKRTDAVVYAVATHHGGRSGFLADVTDTTGGSLSEVESTADLGAAFVAVLNEFRQRYVMSYTPRGVPAGGWHKVVVRVRGRDLKVKARPGYWAGQ